MGDSETTKTKLTDWEQFRRSLISQADGLQPFRSNQMLDLSETDYSAAILRLRPYYLALKLSVSDATIVVNSKAFHHLFPDFIPPIDRQYTIRFFRQSPEQWLDAKGKFRVVQLPSGLDAQFNLFHSTCVGIKRLADSVDRALIEEERERFDVTAPKALDNAIVNYVRLTALQFRSARVVKPG